MDTKQRNRMSPLMMEALQMLKFHLKGERLDFTANWMMSYLSAPPQYDTSRD
jgi:hypothetical protein